MIDILFDIFAGIGFVCTAGALIMAILMNREFKDQRRRIK